MACVSHTAWQIAKSPPELKPKQVHLWRFPLKDKSLPDILNREERQRAKRLRVPDKAHSFVVARTRLRQILSGYLGVTPEEVEFITNEHGKPGIADIYQRRLFFNLSHSGAWGLCGVTLEGDIGVDIEVVQAEMSFIPLAERFFSKDEYAWLLSSEVSRQQRNFFRLWTRKEAWLKGKGKGFSELVLDLDPAHINARSVWADDWFVMNLPVVRGCVGALAVKGRIEGVERFSFI